MDGIGFRVAALGRQKKVGKVVSCYFFAIKEHCMIRWGWSWMVITSWLFVSHWLSLSRSRQCENGHVKKEKPRQLELLPHMICFLPGDTGYRQMKWNAAAVAQWTSLSHGNMVKYESIDRFLDSSMSFMSIYVYLSYMFIIYVYLSIVFFIIYVYLSARWKLLMAVSCFVGLFGLLGNRKRLLWRRQLGASAA